MKELVIKKGAGDEQESMIRKKNCKIILRQDHVNI